MKVSCLVDSNPEHVGLLLLRHVISILHLLISSRRGILICWQFRSPLLTGMRLIRKDLAVIYLWKLTLSKVCLQWANFFFKKLNVLFIPQLASKSCSLVCHCTFTMLQERKKVKPSRMRSLLLCRWVSAEGIFSHSPSGWRKRNSLSTTDQMDRNREGGWQKKGMRKLFLKPREDTVWGRKGRNGIQWALS